MLTKRPREAGEARIRYMDGDLHIIEPGDFVICAVTTRRIPLQALRYWSVDMQEAYATAEAANRSIAGGGSGK